MQALRSLELQANELRPEAQKQLAASLKNLTALEELRLADPVRHQDIPGALEHLARPLASLTSMTKLSLRGWLSSHEKADKLTVAALQLPNLLEANLRFEELPQGVRVEFEYFRECATLRDALIHVRDPNHAEELAQDMKALLSRDPTWCYSLQNQIIRG